MEALFVGCPPSDAPAQITVEHDRSPPPVPADAPDAGTEELRAWYPSSGVTSQHISGATGRREGDRVRVGGIGATADPERAFRMACQLPLMDALRLHDRHVLHAAAVERGGSAIIVLGDSGAGKSTFAFAAAERGWGMVADDLTILAAPAVEGARATVTGFPKPVNIPRDALGEPPPGARTIPDDARRRMALPPTTITARRQYEVVAVVLLEHSGADASHRSLDPGPPVIRSLLESYPLIGVPGAARAFLPIAGALTRGPMYVFAHASSPDDRAAAVGAFLEVVAEQNEGTDRSDRSSGQ